MSRSTDGEGLQGTNWSIERGLVDPDIAAAAAQEILIAIATRNDMISFDHSQPKFGFSGYVISGLEGLTKKERRDPVFAFPALIEVRHSLQPFKHPALLTDRRSGHYDEGFVNITNPNGRVPKHRDNEPWSLVFVSLSAEVKARIKHRDDRNYVEKKLRPGDAVRIVNPPTRKKRPKHEFINLSDTVRISYGEYTSPNAPKFR